MENKINIAELLKDCPKGMELDCTIYDDITLVGVDDTENTIFPIRVLRKDGCSIELTKYGQYADADYARCVIFPKGETTWEGFQRPFMDGDIVATADGLWIGITTGGKSNCFIPTYCVITNAGNFEAYLDRKETWVFHRLATEEEKAKLFQAIKDNDYRWNPETKTLEKLPKFKVGDKIKRKETDYTYIVTIAKLDDDYYDYVNEDGQCGVIYISTQNDWELIPDKFDVTTLKPFKSEVLVRDSTCSIWRPAIFGCIDKSACGLGHYYVLGGICWRYCIPYEGNEHLLSKSDDCDEYFKTWK